MFQVGSRSEANGIAKSGAKMVMAVSCAKVHLCIFLHFFLNLVYTGFNMHNRDMYISSYQSLQTMFDLKY